LPTRTSRWRSPSSQLRMKVESKLTVIADPTAAGFPTAARPSRSSTCNIWPRSVSGLFPASIGSTCTSISAATRKVIRAESRACSWSSSGGDRQCDDQLKPVSVRPQPAHRNRGSCTLASPNSVAVGLRGNDALLNPGLARRPYWRVAPNPRSWPHAQRPAYAIARPCSTGYCLVHIGLVFSFFFGGGCYIRPHFRYFWAKKPFIRLGSE
jgi:hypothetical protein